MANQLLLMRGRSPQADRPTDAGVQSDASGQGSSIGLKSPDPFSTMGTETKVIEEPGLWVQWHLGEAPAQQNGLPA